MALTPLSQWFCEDEGAGRSVLTETLVLTKHLPSALPLGFSTALQLFTKSTDPSFACKHVQLTFSL